ncbi:MAG: F0F1 ATP synthase subunit alpha, partial [Patescibacteria group bacterium]
MPNTFQQSIIDKLKSQIQNLPTQAKIRQIGEVKEIKDGAALISGLSEALMGEMVLFSKTNIYGLVLNLTKNDLGAIVLGEWEKIKQGDIVEATGKVLQVPVGEKLIGRIIDPIGNALDGRGEITTEATAKV